MIALPWPAKELNPNHRVHWAAKAKHVKAARSAAYWHTEASGAFVEGDGAIPLRVTFRAPDKRHRDRDNMIAACKSYMDGIADALAVNDRRFEPTYAWGEPVKGGLVEVVL